MDSLCMAVAQQVCAANMVTIWLPSREYILLETILCLAVTSSERYLDTHQGPCSRHQSRFVAAQG